MVEPVEVAAVHYASSHLGGMSVHILCGGMCDDVASPLKRAAVDWRGECVVNNQRHTVLMGYACEFLDVEHLASRIGDSLAEHGLGIRAERLLDFLIRGILIDKCALDAQFLKRDTEEIKCATVNLVRCDDMVARLADVKHRIEVGSLSRRGKHSPHSTFERGNRSCHRIIGGVLQSGIEIPLFLEVEEQCHLVTVIIFECCTLHYRQFNRFTIFRLIARMKAK